MVGRIELAMHYTHGSLSFPLLGGVCEPFFLQRTTPATRTLSATAILQSAAFVRVGPTGGAACRSAGSSFVFLIQIALLVCHVVAGGLSSVCSL